MKEKAVNTKLYTSLCLSHPNRRSVKIGVAPMPNISQQVLKY